MHKRKLLKWICLPLLLLIAVLFVGIGIVRYNNGVSMATLDGVAPINESGYVEIGGVRQWLRVRGQNRSNPVILYLHGGPGGAITSLTYGSFRTWERDFTVVHWDQRGAGLTFAENGSGLVLTLSIRRLTADGIEIAEYLRKRLGKQKIVVVGHSWGSMLGMHMVRERPDLFAAFVGVGLVADVLESQASLYATALAKARTQNNAKAVRELESVASLLETDAKRFTTIRKWAAGGKNPSAWRRLQLLAVTLLSPEYSLGKLSSYGEGASILQVALSAQMVDDEVLRTTSEYKLPMFLLHGAEDEQTSSVAARKYFDRMTAPVKETVIFEGEGHFVHINSPKKFLDEMKRLLGSIS